MGRVDTSFAALAAAVMLSSCGGDGSSTPTPVATATPTPTPSPTPSPTPAFSYSAYDQLTGLQEFSNVCESSYPDGETLQTVKFTEDPAVSFDFDNQILTVLELGTATPVEFSEADITSSDSRVTHYYQFLPLPSDPTRVDLYNASVFTPTVAGTAVSYTRRIYYSINRDRERRVVTNCFIGIPTAPADLLGQSAFTYSDFQFEGGGIDLSDPSIALAIDVIGGSGSLAIDPAAKSGTFSLFVELEDLNGVRRTLGPVTGTVPFDEASDRIGLFGSVVGGPTGDDTANAAFFGPDGREVGIILTLNLDLDSSGSADSILQVLVTGTR